MSSSTVIKPGVASAVNTAQGSRLPAPKFQRINTNNLENPFFHGMIYGPTNSGKTLVAATFGGPKRTRIINTRNESQLITLQGMGYECVTVRNYGEFEYAVLYPERVWPEWAEIPDRTLVIDDISEGAESTIEDNRTNDNGQEIKNTVLVFRGVRDAMRDLLIAATRKPQHLIFTALARTGRDDIAGRETIDPDVPPSIHRMIGAEIEYCFFIDADKKKLLTDNAEIVVKDPLATDPVTRQPIMHRRKIFSKYKQSAASQGRLIEKYEEMDLGRVWEKIKGAKGAAK